MKKNAVFVNIGRGQTVDTDALVRALKSNTIVAAGLDVTDPEPLPVNHELLKLPNASEYRDFWSTKKKNQQNSFICTYSSFTQCIVYSPFVYCQNYTNMINYLFTVIIPHMGSQTIKTRNDMAIVAAQNILNGFEGKPLLYEL